MFWDFLSSNQESIHQVLYNFSDRGTPQSYRKMNTYSGHTFKFCKEDGSFKYVKLHFLSNQGHENFTNDEAIAMQSSNPDHNTEDLFNAISKGEYPSWTLKIQVLDPADAEHFRFNIFDVTKIWPHKDVPFRTVGTLTLNRNPENYFAEIEQLAFAPAHLVPGIEPTVDPMLQARLFSYADSQRHRLGVNYQQLPVNKPLHAYNPFQRDGPAAINGNYGAVPNYPSPLRPNTYRSVDANADKRHEEWVGRATWNPQEVTDEDFVQARWFWEMLGKQQDQQEHLVYNIASHLSGANDVVRQRTYEYFGRVTDELGQRVNEKTEQIRREKAKAI